MVFVDTFDRPVNRVYVYGSNLDHDRLNNPRGLGHNGILTVEIRKGEDMNYRIEMESGEDITDRHGNNRYRYYTDLDLARFWAIKKSRDLQVRTYLRDDTKILNIYEAGKPVQMEEIKGDKMTKKIRRYKFLRTGLKSNYDGFQWKLGTWHKTECTELCHGFNCSEKILSALYYVQGEILGEVETRGTHFTDIDKSTWEEMRVVRAWIWKKEDSVRLAIFSAELVIDLFEKKYPADKRPRLAIDAAKNWLIDPSKAAEAASGAASAAASGAASAAAARAAEAASAAAFWAYEAAPKNEILEKIDAWLIKHLTEMEEIKNE